MTSGVLGPGFLCAATLLPNASFIYQRIQRSRGKGLVNSLNGNDRQSDAATASTSHFLHLHSTQERGLLRDPSAGKHQTPAADSAETPAFLLLLIGDFPFRVLFKADGPVQRSKHSQTNPHAPSPLLCHGLDSGLRRRLIDAPSAPPTSGGPFRLTSSWTAFSHLHKRNVEPLCSSVCSRIPGTKQPFSGLCATGSEYSGGSGISPVLHPQPLLGQLPPHKQDDSFFHRLHDAVPSFDLPGHRLEDFRPDCSPADELQTGHRPGPI